MSAAVGCGADVPGLLSVDRANVGSGLGVGGHAATPWLLGILGAAVGFGQAPTSIPYITGLATLAAVHPRPAGWPLLIYAYWTLALTPSLLILFLATRKTTRAVRIQRGIVRGLTRYGPISVRILFLVVGVGLVADALLFRSVLW